MELRVLGAHNQESRTTRLVSLLVDGVLALDAGALTSTLSLPEQRRIEALLLTHRHYDHIRDLPILALNTLDCGATLPVYAPDDAILHLQDRFMDGAPLPRLHPATHPGGPAAPASHRLAARWRSECSGLSSPARVGAPSRSCPRIPGRVAGRPSALLLG